MQIWIHDNKMKKITALNNDVPDMLSYTNSTWHSYLDQATSTFDFTIPKFSNGELHEDLKLINDECFVSFYVNGSYQVFYIATLQEDDFNIQLTCNNTNLEYALEYADPFSSDSAQTIEWYLNKMYFLSYAAVEIGLNEISDRKRTLTFDSQETKMNRLQSLMSKFEAEFEFKVELNRDGTYKRIAINIYQKDHIGTDRKDVVLYYSNGLKGVQVNSDKTQMFTSGIFTGKDGLNLADVEISEKNSDGIEEFYSRKGDVYLRAPLAMQRYPSTMRVEGQDNWINKNFQTEYENVNDLKAYALRTLKQYAYPLMTYTASVQSGFVSQYTDLKLGDTIRIIDNNFVGGLALEARVSEMIISFDNPANNSFVFTNYRKIDNKPSAALQTRIEQTVESKLPYRIELATTGGVAFKNNEGETIVKPSLYKGNLPYTKDVSWHWALGGVVTVGTQYRIQARDITDSEVLTVAAYVGNLEVATTEITLTNVNDGVGVESIDRYFTSSDQSDGVTIEGAEWSDKPPAPTEDGKYLWAYDEIIYTDGTVTTTKPAAVGANFDVDAFRAEIAEDLKDVPNREEFENKISEEIANSKAEITTQIETAKTQAESNAKEYADTINRETAKVAELANAASAEIKADLVNVKNSLTATSIVANNAQAAVDEAKQDLTEVASDLSAAKQDLTDSVTAVNTKVDSAKAELTQAKQELTNVADDLSQAKTDLQNAVSAVDTKATNLKNDLDQAKQDLASQAQQLQEQATAQSELTNRVSSVEKTANGTKTTVSELSKTVAQNGKDITSVTARTKVVEDDLAGTKTTLSQVKTTADSTSQKTATLETGLNGLSAKFDNLKIGGRNLLAKTNQGKTNWSWVISSGGTTAEDYNVDGVNAVKLTRTKGSPSSWDYIQYNGLIRKLIEPNTQYTLSFDVKPSVDVTFTAILQRGDGGAPLTNTANMNKALANKWTKASCVLTSKATLPDDLSQVVYLSSMPIAQGNYLIIKNIKLEKGNVATDYSPSEVDFEQKVAEYKQTADQNYASLQTTVQNLDGTVQANKTTAEQTAQGFTTRIESLETYKDGESERANAYFESAKTETAKQLTAERTAIAKDYVAKSTYTSDVTGIRNDLSATTTTANTIKTNLANYQASNDRAVANLQTNLQTANGNISSLKTKVEAVPGQITSAVSAVEGKIPTSLDSLNLMTGTRDWSTKTNAWHMGEGWSTENGEYQGLKVHSTQKGYNGSHQNIFVKNGDVVTFSFFAKATNTLSKIRVSPQWTGSSVYQGPLAGIKESDEQITITSEWKRYSKTVHIISDGSLQFRTEYAGHTIPNGNTFYVAGLKLSKSSLDTGYSENPTDTAEQLSNLSSEIKQTADGMTLLATKTELNSAKNELQSGINTATNKANNNAQTISTHTTQISALNTGLSAKVSQSDFNTLSGRVTTAENNIIAKANELSSKISSVEGKIPTSLDSLNLMTGTRDWSTKTNAWHMGEGWSTENGEYQGLKVHSTQKGYNGSHQNIFVKNGDVVTFSFFAKATNTLSKIRVSPQWTGSSVYQGPLAGIKESDEQITITSEWKRYSKTVHIISDGSLQFRTEYAGHTIPNGNTFYVAGLKLSKSSLDTGYSENPTDTAEQLSNLSSEIKQTADGMTLLATKTELNSAKNELQSGINTATNKANNNAQTISTHTTQISALNTGLSAKVSQSDFNTLSGRVTTAENNIIAKANELSSKISSVEGKIPTSLDSLNLMTGTRDWSTKTNAWHMGEGWSTENGEYQGLKVHSTQKGYNGSHQNIFVKNGDVVTFSFFAKATNTLSKIRVSPQWTGSSVYQGPLAGIKESDEQITITSEWKRYSKTVHIISDGSLQFRTEYAGHTIPNGNTFYVAGLKLSKSSLDTGYSENPTDTAEQLSNLSSEIKQTADGMTLLATKTELNSAKNELQSGINTATNKANNNAQTISTHTTQISALNTGLSAKVSQSDFNTLSGRVTTAENNIIAKANELSSKISSVEGKIPTSAGGRNLAQGTSKDWSKPFTGFSGVQNICPVLYRVTTDGLAVGDTFKTRIVLKYTNIVPASGKTAEIWLQGSGNVTLWKNGIYPSGGGGRRSISGSGEIVFELTDKIHADHLKNAYWELSFRTDWIASGSLQWKLAKAERGMFFTDWSPAPEDTINQISSLSSEFKQTTDAIKASVSSLDKSTVKSSSLTINADGIVMKAGKSTTDVANAIGSYFAVNQNAINLFSDKINVKGNMIVSGAITSDKIASKSINTAHLNGKIITADVISSNAVTADAIKAGAVTTDKMSANSINGDRITAGTLDAAKIKAGSITASQIASGTITSAQIKTGTISAANIAAGAITSDKIASNSISSDKIVASGITANVIKGGVLTALNNAMQVNLDDSNITFSNNASVIFTSSDNALKRVIANKPSQFIKMYDEVFVSEIGELPNSTLTVIGSNSDRTESSDSSGFGGLRIWNGRSSTATTSFAELVGNRVAIYGNKNRSPWLFDMTGTTSYLIPQNSNGIKHSLGRSDRPFYSVYADNMYIQGERVAMMLKDIALHIGYGGNNGWVGRIQ